MGKPDKPIVQRLLIMVVVEISIGYSECTRGGKQVPSPRGC